MEVEWPHLFMGVEHGISFRWDLYLMRDSKQPKLLLELGTDSENELLDERVCKSFRDVRRYITFIRDILVLAEP